MQLCSGIRRNCEVRWPACLSESFWKAIRTRLHSNPVPMPLDSPVCLSLRSPGPTCKPIHVSSFSLLSSPLAVGGIIWSLTCSRGNHIREQGSVTIRDHGPPTGKYGKWLVGSAVAGIKLKDLGCSATYALMGFLDTAATKQPSAEPRATWQCPS